MRLGWILDGRPDQISGGYLYDAIVVDHLRRRGVEVEIISLPPRSYLSRWLGGVPASAERRIRTSGFDVLVQDELSHAALTRMNRRLARSVPDCPRVSLVHHLRSSEPAPGPARMLVRSIERAYLRSVDAFIFNSQSTRASVARLRPQLPAHVVAVPAADRLPAVEEDPSRFFHVGPLRLLFVGNLIPRKGLRLLVEALALNPPGALTLTVIGDPRVDPGHVRRILRWLHRYSLQDRVAFLGALNAEGVAREMAAHHVLVVPSAYEGYGMAYLEGMGFGLPAVAGWSGGASEFIREGVNGLLVDPADAPGLAAVLLGLHQDRDHLDRMSQAARLTYREHPTWEDTGRRVDAFLIGLANRSS